MTTSDNLKAYSLELKINKLKQFSKRLDKEIEDIINNIDQNSKMYAITKDDEYKKRNDSLKKELCTTRINSGRLELIINKKELQLKILQADESLKDEEIVLINNSDSIEGKYNIYRIEDEKKVGFISYFPKYYETDIGSVGYEVFEQYRGHQYAYKSLKMLCGFLIDHGVEKVSIVADINNTSSINVMEKFKSDVQKIEEPKKYSTMKKYDYTLKK